MNQRSSKRSQREPNWSDWSQRRYGGVPIDAQAWLRDTGSLTKRVIEHCGEGRFRVRLLQQGWDIPLNSERQALHIRQGRLALIRDVVLLCEDAPWVFARTWIPVKTLKGSARRLMQLGERPLGAVLFSDPKVSRGSTLIARLTPGHTLFDAASSQLEQMPEQLWGRRTLFYVDSRPILINELFLPDLPMQRCGKQ
ncbi:MAG: chorismate lyase [Candidatus Thiodiazotropha sp. 6PLUC2]